MGVCVKICASKLNRKIEVLSRDLKGPRVGSSKSSTVFTAIESPWAEVITLSGTGRYKNVNIDEKATHLFKTRFSSALEKLDGNGETFILMNNASNQAYLYKILKVTNTKEQNCRVST